MSDNDKLMAFGSWLTTRRLQLTGELYALAINREAPLDSLRIKAGQMEAYTQVLESFTELYRGDLSNFMRERLGQKPEEEE